MVKISIAELEVMKIIWNKEESTSQEIINELKNIHDWNDTTVRTLIKRLVDKNAIGVSKLNNKKHIYTPLINRDDYKVVSSKGVLSKLYQNSIEKMIMNFVDNNKVSKEKIDVLIKQIDEDKKDKR